jgi:NADPH2:quinone reductase
VLVHAAAGGLGTAAVQLAREHGAQVFGTASTDDKRRYVESLGATARAYGDLADLRPDIVIDPVGGRLTRDSLRLLPAFGRLVLVGLAAAEPTPLDAASLIHRSLCVHGVHLDDIVADVGLRTRALAVILPWLIRGRIAVQIGHVLPLAELARAHDLIARRETAGKLLVELP